jgi:hypothetical protein
VEKNKEVGAMAGYIDPDKFLPKGVINTLKSSGAWDLDDSEWEEKIDELEKRAVSTIRASVNFTELSTDEQMITELITLYVQFSLMSPLTNMVQMMDNADVSREQYNNLIELIKTNQRENGIFTAEESTVSVAGAVVF